MRFYSVCLGLVLALSLNAQIVDVDSLRLKFKEEGAAYSTFKEKLTIKMEKDKLVSYSDHESMLWFLKDNASDYADRSIHYYYFTGISDIHAVSFIPTEKKGKYNQEFVTKITENNTSSSGVFYGSTKRKAFVYPKAQKNGAGFLQYRETYNDPHFIGSYYFSTYVPIEYSQYSVSFPSEVKIEYTLFNTEKYKIDFKSEVKKGITTYTWTTRDIPSNDAYSNSPALSYYAPHVVVRIAEVKHKNGEVEKLLPDVKGLYDYYYGFVENVNQEENVELKKLVDSLVKNVPNRDEKARTIFNWVQNNVKYIAFEDGMGGFIPREAAMVCQKRYGDCKDMASIITEMLQYAGIEGSLTWVGSRDIPYTYEEMPTPAADNHMISSYRNDKGEVVFLDAVGYYTPYGFPTAFIQGKEALRCQGKGVCEVVTVPVIPKERNARKDSLQLQIEGDVLVGTGMIDSRGYDKIDFVNNMLNDNEEKRKEKLKATLDKGNNKIDYGHAKFYGLENRDTNLSIAYDFKLPDYLKVSGDDIFINMNLEKELRGSQLDIKKRKGIPLDNEYKYQEEDINVLSVPKGYRVDYVPSNVEYQNDYFGFNISYKNEGEKVTMTKKHYINYLILKEDQFVNFNNMIKELNKAYSEVVVLQKVTKATK